MLLAARLIQPGFTILPVTHGWPAAFVSGRPEASVGFLSVVLDAEKSPLRSAALGTRSTVDPTSGLFQSCWKYPKKNSLSFLTGPPAATPAWFCRLVGRRG